MPRRPLGCKNPRVSKFRCIPPIYSFGYDYRAAKGLCSNRLGASSEELADPELVNDDTLLLVLRAALIARYGPDVMKIGVAER